MRRQQKILLWPDYFDSNKTRLQGRRVSRSIAVTSPKLEEIHSVAKRMSLNPQIVVNARYSKSPWRKTGFVLVEKKSPKTQTIQKIAKEVANMRK